MIMASYYKSIFFYLFSLTTFSIHVIASNRKLIESKGIEVINDLPSHKDLQIYLSSLERIIDFLSKNKEYLDLNCIFGLFLVNVNLRSFVKNEALPVYLRYHLNDMLMQNEMLIKFQGRKVETTNDRKHEIDKIIASLFTNETSWSKRLMKLNLRLLKKTLSYEYHYPKWSSYIQEVDKIDEGVPSPRLSDSCMIELAENQENPGIRRQCLIPGECRKMLATGTNFGYGLTHRLLFLIHAGFSLKCSIFDPQQDDSIRDSFCETAYREAEYIVLNGYKIVDLIFEQMALCTLDGHAQFLRASWISNLLKYQSLYGCFNDTIPTYPRTSFGWEKGDNGLDGACNGHVTAVAAATLAAAVRFILENL